MRGYVSIISGLIALGSALPYIVDTARGRTHPNVVTWFTWALLDGIATIAAVVTGAMSPAFLTGSAMLACTVIAAMGLRRGVRKYTSFDIICQVAALVGIAIWTLTHRPEPGVAIAMTVSMVASFPTWRHAWMAPFAETWQAFAIGALAAAMTISTISHYGFVSLAGPLQILINCIVLVAIILARRRVKLKATAFST